MLPPLDLFPGWRIDPDVPHSERFWDGRQWTDKLRPMPRTAIGERQADRSRGEIGTPDGITIVAAEPQAQRQVPIPRPELVELPPPTPAQTPRLELVELPPPRAETLAERAVLKPVPAPAPGPAPTPAPTPAQVSIFGAATGPGGANRADFFEVARRVQLPASGQVSRSPARRLQRSRLVVVAAICLVVGAAVGFGAGYQFGSGDASGGAPAGVTE